jgi:hypothetical protein
MAAVPTNIPANYVAVKKSVNNPNPAPGSTVTFTVRITLGSSKSGLSLIDNLSGPGISSTSDYVPNSARLDGVPLADPVVGSTPNPNRRQNVFTLPSPLSGGPSSVHTLTYEWNIANTIPCNTYLSNGVNLRQSGVAGNLASDTIALSTKCGTTTTAPVTTTIAVPCTTSTGITQTFNATSTLTFTTTTTSATTTTTATTTTVTFTPFTPPAPGALGPLAVTTITTTPCVTNTSTANTTSTSTTSTTTTSTTRTTQTTTRTTTTTCLHLGDLWTEPEQKIASAQGVESGPIAGSFSPCGDVT